LTFLIGEKVEIAECSIDPSGIVPVLHAAENQWIFSVGPTRWVASCVLTMARLNREIGLP